MQNKWFVWSLSDQNRVMFYSRQTKAGQVWSFDPKDAFDFGPKDYWDPCGCNPNCTSRKHISAAAEFADKNGGRVCCGDPKELLKVHDKGPRVGQRVRVKEVRSDGRPYGEGYVLSYCGYQPHFLSHVVCLDDPPKFGAPNEFGDCAELDSDTAPFPAHALEVT
jgi:hypothetical protein